MDIKDNRGWHFTQIENSLLDDTENYDIYEKMVYICLCRFANKKSNSAYPSATKISSMIGCSERKVRECINSLHDKKVIVKEERKGKSPIIHLMNLTPEHHAGVEHTPERHSGHPGTRFRTTPAHGSDEREKGEREKPNEISLQIKNLRQRYSDNQLKIIDSYLDMIRHTRVSAKIAESVILKMYRDWDKYPQICVEYGLRTHTENPAYHSKRENYTLGIIRNTTSDEAYKKLYGDKQKKEQKTEYKSDSIDSPYIDLVEEW